MSMSDYGSVGAYDSLGSYANYGAGTFTDAQGKLGVSNPGRAASSGVFVNENTIQLQSLTFLNPEYELETFLNDYMEIRMVNFILFSQTLETYVRSFQFFHV
jgi:hypothetical protein